MENENQNENTLAEEGEEFTDDQSEGDDWNISGFAIHVCLPSQALQTNAAAEIEEWLPKQYGYSLPPLRPDFGPYHRGGFMQEWWNTLVFCSAEDNETGKTSNLDSAPLWLTAFLPIDIKPGPLWGPPIPDSEEGEEGEPVVLIDCASLPGAVNELRRFAREYNLPDDLEGLRALCEEYNDEYLWRHAPTLTENGFVDPMHDEEDEPDAEDEGMIRVYAEFMLAADIAMREGLPLWVIK